MNQTKCLQHATAFYRLGKWEIKTSLLFIVYGHKIGKTYEKSEKSEHGIAWPIVMTIETAFQKQVQVD